MSDIGKAIKDTADNVRDKVSETLHRSAADAEATRRDVSGDTMTTKDKVSSVISEANHRLAAEIDAGKQAVRKNA